MIKLPGAELSAPLELNGAQNIMDSGVSRVSAPGEANHARAALVGRIAADDIAELFQAAKQLVHGLLAHARALRQHTRPDAIGAGKLQHRHMGHDQFLEAGGIELANETALDDLSRNAQQAPISISSVLITLGFRLDMAGKWSLHSNTVNAIYHKEPG